MKELEELIILALKDGIVSHKERQLILKKARVLGIDEIEAEMILEGMISDHENGNQITLQSEEIKLDGYSIDDAELILRTTKWVNRCADNNISTEVLAFPKLIEKKSNFRKKIDGAIDVTGNIASKLGKAGVVGALKFVPGVGSVVGGLIDNLSNNETKVLTLNNKEIIELTNQYLIILELRSPKNQSILNKYIELKAIFEEKINSYNNKGFFKKLW